jgi:hypothetical protein
VIPVYNDGYLSTSNLVVSASVQGQDLNLGSQTVSIGAKSTVNVSFDVDASVASDIVRYEVKVEVVGDDAAYVTEQINEGSSNEKVIDFPVQYYIEVNSDDLNFFTVVIVILGALVIFGGVKASRSGSKANRF